MVVVYFTKQIYLFGQLHPFCCEHAHAYQYSELRDALNGTLGKQTRGNESTSIAGWFGDGGHTAGDKTQKQFGACQNDITWHEDVERLYTI